MKLEKRPRRQKVRRIKPRASHMAARHFRIYPDPASPVGVEVYVFRTRAQMLARLEWWDRAAHDRMTMGLCRSWSAPRQRLAGITRPQQVVAWVFLNQADVRAKPSEIVTHECGHAAMAWARFRGANLKRMHGEEVMCHALGRLVAQANHHLYAIGAFH